MPSDWLTHEWAACVEGYEEGGYRTGETREHAIDAALEDVSCDTSTGWAAPGVWLVTVVHQPTWEPIPEEDRSEEHTHLLLDWDERMSVLVSVDADGDWTEVADAD